MADQKWDFKRSKSFDKSFSKLSPEQQKQAKQAFKNEFKKDPFAKSHKINRLSSLMRETVRSFHIEGDFITTWVVRGNQIVALDIGDHEIYKK